MPNEFVGLIGFAVLTLMIFSGVPIAIAMLSVSIGGLIHFIGLNATFQLFVNNSFSLSANFTFSALPMFLLMGYFAYYSGLVSEAYDSASLWLSKLRGGLAMATCLASGMIGACMGSGAAATAAMSRIAVPEMIRHGYDKSLATGTVAAAATVAVLIPPSMIMVVYASLTGTSLGKMLLAGYIPALLSIAIYLAMIGIRLVMKPDLAPSAPSEGVTWTRRIHALKDVWGIVVLVAVILGGIYSGIFTATEAAALAAAAALVLLFISGKISWTVVQESSYETLRICVFTFLLMIGANLFSSFIAFSRIPRMLTSIIVDTQMPVFSVLLLVILVIFFLGCFMDSLAIMFLTLPTLLPIFENLNIDLIWFGILFIKMAEVAAITPPFGTGVYIVKGVIGSEVPIGSIFRGIFWFILMDLLTVAILWAFPQISLWLPTTIRGG